MRVVGIIPARYASTRLPGKPLEDILGYPMIWWVYKRVSKVKQLNEIIVATDDERILSVCRSRSAPRVNSRELSIFSRCRHIIMKVKTEQKSS